MGRWGWVRFLKTGFYLVCYFTWIWYSSDQRIFWVKYCGEIKGSSKYSYLRGQTYFVSIHLSLSLSQICVDVSMMVSGYDLVSLEAKQGPSCGLASGPCAYNAAIEIDTSFYSTPFHQSSWLKLIINTFLIWLIIDGTAMGKIEFQYDEHKEVWNPESKNRCKFTEMCEIWHICLRGGLFVNIAHTAPAGDIVVNRWLWCSAGGVFLGLKTL